ncbi:MAG: hypothetical protein FD156_797 [Nitrospirae bacterium]|nr:MAG: hypothetical protein FD156_797 [Nitrospirota bacterium]
MKGKTVRYLVFVSFIIFFLTGTAFALTFNELENNLDTDKNTKVSVKEYWKTVKGQEVSWTGSVVDVTSGKNRYKVSVKLGSRSRPNISLLTSDSAAATLKKGQSVRFKGSLRTYRKWGSHFTVELDDVTIQK